MKRMSFSERLLGRFRAAFFLRDVRPHRLQVRPPVPGATPLSELRLPPFPVVVPDVMPFLVEDRESGR